MAESFEFLIEVIDRVADGYRLRVAFPDPDSPTGVGENRVTAPFDPADPELLRQLTLLPTSVIASAAKTRLAVSPMEQTAQSVGHHLFQALMVGETLGDLSRLRRRAAAAGADVRVSLRIQPAELAALPWEYLFDARADRREFLGRACMVTRSSGDLSPVPPLDVAGPLRVLAMVSLPGDLAALDADLERRQLADALAPMVADGRVELTWIPATKAALQTALNQQRWHVFHYIGHGDFDAAAGEGRLAFTGAGGGAEFVSARQLAVSFGQHPTLRLVVLNACQSSQSSADDRRSGVASALVHAGLAAVVAMQFPITDGAAPVFSGEFYATLAAGRPVDHCVRAGRTAITLENGASLEWGTPVLHLRSADGLLFRQTASLAGRPEPDAARDAAAALAAARTEAAAVVAPAPDPWAPEVAPVVVLEPAPSPAPAPVADVPHGDDRRARLQQLGMDYNLAHERVLRGEFSDALLAEVERILVGYIALGDTGSLERVRKDLSAVNRAVRRGVSSPAPSRPDAVPPEFLPAEDDEELPRSRTQRSKSGAPAESRPKTRTSAGIRAAETRVSLRTSVSSSMTMEAPVTALALSPHSVPRLAVAMDNGVVLVMDPDPEDGQNSTLWLRHADNRNARQPAAVQAIRFSPFGATVACLTGRADLPEHVAVWDARSGAPVSPTGPASLFAYHPAAADRYLAGTTAQDLALRSVGQPRQPLVRYPSDSPWHEPGGRNVAVSPDGRYVLIVGTRRALVCRADDGTRVLELPTGPMPVGSGGFTSDSACVVLPDAGDDLVAHRLPDGARVGAVRIGPARALPRWALGPVGLVVTLHDIPGDAAVTARVGRLDQPGLAPVEAPGRFHATTLPVFSKDGDFFAVLDADGRTVHLIDVLSEA